MIARRHTGIWGRRTRLTPHRASSLVCLTSSATFRNGFRRNRISMEFSRSFLEKRPVGLRVPLVPAAYGPTTD